MNLETSAAESATKSESRPMDDTTLGLLIALVVVILAVAIFLIVWFTLPKSTSSSDNHSSSIPARTRKKGKHRNSQGSSSGENDMDFVDDNFPESMEEAEDYAETHSAEALILSCIDYRFVTPMTEYLNSGTLFNRYDISVLAGASLGYNQTKFKCWGETFIDFLELATELHHIRQVIVFDHMDCGAYKLFYPYAADNPEKEKRLHIENINQFIAALKQLYPDLIYSGYLILVDGTIEQIYR